MVTNALAPVPTNRFLFSLSRANDPFPISIAADPAFFAEKRTEPKNAGAEVP